MLQGIRVSLLEPDEEVRHRFAAALEDAGAEVVAAGGALPEVLDVVADGDADLVVADVSAARDAVPLVERAAELDVPLVALYADELPPEVEHALHAATATVLVKPVTASELCAAAADLVAEAR